MVGSSKNMTPKLIFKYGKPSLIRINEAKESPERQKNLEFRPLSEAEIQGLLHAAETNLGYFLAWFQSLQLP
jgi:hypothetical protein